jgi:hypothetical protein
LPNRKELIGPEKASTPKEWHLLLTTDLPPLVRITWTFDGKTMSMQFEDANRKPIDASKLQIGGIQLQKGVNALEDSVRIDLFKKKCIQAFFCCLYEVLTFKINRTLISAKKVLVKFSHLYKIYLLFYN